MFLRKAKKAFIKRMTILTLVLSSVIGLVFYLFMPDRYFICYPFIPVYFYLFGLFYINMFFLAYRLGEDKMIPLFLASKGVKFIVSIIVVLAYCLVVRHAAMVFVSTFMLFYVSFLIFETVYFVNTELRLKRKKQLKHK